MPTGNPRRSSYASVVSGSASANYQPSRSGAFANLLSHQQNSEMPYDLLYQGINGTQRYDHRGFEMDISMNGGTHGRSGSWSRGGQLPNFSSAFGSLVNGPGYGVHGGAYTEHFFVPSYLKSSKYVQILEEAYKARVLSHKDGLSAPSSQPGSLSTSASSVNMHTKMAPSHRGMTYDLIEKLPPAEDEALPPLPSKWNNHDKNSSLEVMPDGLEVKFAGSGVKPSAAERDHEACAIRADHPMPSQCGIYYYEVTLLSRKREEYAFYNLHH